MVVLDVVKVLCLENLFVRKCICSQAQEKKRPVDDPEPREHAALVLQSNWLSSKCHSAFFTIALP